MIFFGMNWFSRYETQIDCLKKRVTLFLSNESCVVHGFRGVLSYLILFVKVDKLWKKGCMIFLASIRDNRMDFGSIIDVPLVQEFSYVFPKELVDFPSHKNRVLY